MGAAVAVLREHVAALAHIIMLVAMCTGGAPALAGWCILRDKQKVWQSAERCFVCCSGVTASVCWWGWGGAWHSIVCVRVCSAESVADPASNQTYWSTRRGVHTSRQVQAGHGCIQQGAGPSQRAQGLCRSLPTAHACRCAGWRLPGHKQPCPGCVRGHTCRLGTCLGSCCTPIAATKLPARGGSLCPM